MQSATKMHAPLVRICSPSLSVVMCSTRSGKFGYWCSSPSIMLERNCFLRLKSLLCFSPRERIKNGYGFCVRSLQQWMEYCPRGRKPTCPICKQGCSSRDVHRLFFQSVSADPTQQPQSPLQTSKNGTVTDDPLQVLGVRV